MQQQCSCRNIAAPNNLPDHDDLCSCFGPHKLGLSHHGFCTGGIELAWCLKADSVACYQQHHSVSFPEVKRATVRTCIMHSMCSCSPQGSAQALLVLALYILKLHVQVSTQRKALQLITSVYFRIAGVSHSIHNVYFHLAQPAHSEKEEQSNRWKQS